MGVLSCDRRGCSNIMCDRYSYTRGYICNECFSELVKSKKDIDEFMESYKEEFSTVAEINYYDIYNKEFPVYDP